MSRKKLYKRIKILLSGLFLISIVALLALSYGKWEFLTLKYGKVLKLIVVSNFIDSRLLSNPIKSEMDIQQFKIFNYQQEYAQVFIEDILGNKWLMSLHKENGLVSRKEF